MPCIILGSVLCSSIQRLSWLIATPLGPFIVELLEVDGHCIGTCVVPSHKALEVHKIQLCSMGRYLIRYDL